MFGLGLPELIVILIIVLMLFGASRLPLLSKNLGKSGRAFKDAYTDGKNDKSLKDIAKDLGGSAIELKKHADSIKKPRL